MGFEERVALLVDAEWNSRQNNKLIRCIREARFAEPGAAVEDIEYYEDRHLDKAQLLRFTTCDLSLIHISIHRSICIGMDFDAVWTDIFSSLAQFPGGDVVVILITLAAGWIGYLIRPI